MTTNYVLVNGELCPADDANLNIRDLAIQRGYGIFDFLKTVDGKAIFLEDHLDRFYNSARIMHLEVSQTREELKAQIYKLMAANDIPNSGIKITLTGGYSADGYLISEPNLIITQTAFQFNRDFTKTIKLMTYNYRRQLNAAKTLDYMTAIWLQQELASRKADDILYHYDNLIGECPRANLFIVTRDNRVLTAANHVLKGVTRKHVLELSRELYEAAEADITLEDLFSAKEVFITSTTKNILAVSHIDDKPVGDGTAGEVTMDLARRYDLVFTAAQQPSAF